MPSSDYSNAVGGGLKLKGPNSAGVKKKKKKVKAEADTAQETAGIKEMEKSELPDQSDQLDRGSALIRALADEEKDGVDAQDQQVAESKEHGKTEAQRRFEERRRKRVRLSDDSMPRAYATNVKILTG